MFQLHIRHPPEHLLRDEGFLLQPTLFSFAVLVASATPSLFTLYLCRFLLKPHMLGIFLLNQHGTVFTRHISHPSRHCHDPLSARCTAILNQLTHAPALAHQLGFMHSCRVFSCLGWCLLSLHLLLENICTETNRSTDFLHIACTKSPYS